MPEPNRYRVRAAEADGGWVVEIVDPGGEIALARRCGSREEARAFESTVRQHIGWLSEARLREYYRLPDPGRA